MIDVDLVAWGTWLALVGAAVVGGRWLAARGPDRLHRVTCYYDDPQGRPLIAERHDLPGRQAAWQHVVTCGADRHVVAPRLR